MRLAAVGDIHGHENLAAVAADLDRLGPVDLVLLAGDTTDRNDLEEYRHRIGVLDDLLAGDDLRILLTHYPPTYVTMGGEKEEWRPELGCKALEPILLRRRPALVIHGHIHKGIPQGELRPSLSRLDDFAETREPVPIHNVAYPVRRAIATFDL